MPAPPAPTTAAATVAPGVPDPLPPDPQQPAVSRLTLPIAVVVTLLQMTPEWTAPYRAGFDECLLLQAGASLAAGQGLTCVERDGLADLAAPEFTYLSGWPPLWSLIFAALLSTGMGEGAALAGLSAVKTLAAFAGTWGWMRLAGRVLPAPAWAVAAVAVAALMFGNTQFGQAVLVGPSHLLLWALVPWWAGALLDGVRTGRAADFLRAGLIAVPMPGLRFIAVPLIAGGAAGTVFALRGPWMGRLWRAAVMAVPPAMATLAILVVQRANSHHGMWVADRFEQGWHFDKLLSREVATSWFLFGFGLEETVFKFKPSAAPTGADPWPAWVFLPWYGFLAAAAWAGVRAMRNGPAEAGTGAVDDNGVSAPDRGRHAGQRALLWIGLCTVAGVWALLMLTSARAGPDAWFVPIREQRYFAEVLPLLGLAWLILLSRAVEAGARTGPRPQDPSTDVRPSVGTLTNGDIGAGFGAVLATVAAGAMLVLAVRFVAYQGRDVARAVRDLARVGRPEMPPVPAALLERVARLPAGSSHRAFDWYLKGISDLLWRRGLSGGGIPNVDELRRTSCSRPMFVMVVVRWEYDRPTGQGRPGELTVEGLRLVRFLGLPAAGEVVAFDKNTLCTVHAGWVAPFTAEQARARMNFADQDIALPPAPCGDPTTPGWAVR